jgi:hypothetical protein
MASHWRTNTKYKKIEKQKQNTLGDLFKGISSDINNILASIRILS